MTVDVSGLTKCFVRHKNAQPVYALKNIHLNVKKGEVLGIIGMSGAGKSTLMRCLIGLDLPTEGSVLIEGQEISSLQGKYLRQARRKVGMIFQHFNLFDAKKVWENIAYPLEIEGVSLSRRRQKAQELLKLVGLTHKENSYPSQLSGGEKQRVGIARALACDPSVLFCDEATSALDPATTQTILNLLAGLNKSLGLTIVLITHEMEVVKKICTYVSVLEKGEIVEEGRVEKVFSSPQHLTTREFLKHVSHDLPPHYHLKNPDSELLRLFFKGEEAEKPIISRLIKRFDVEVNILLGGIDSLRTVNIGYLVIELSGPSKERVLACQFLKDEGVVLESLQTRSESESL